MITWTKRLRLTCALLGLLATNILTLTSVAFNAALSGFMTTTLGIATVTSTLQSKIAKQDKAIKKRKVVVRKFGNRLATRTKRVAPASVAAIPGEAIPFPGAVVLVAGTAYELYEACEAMKDLDELYAGLGMDEEAPGDVLAEVCGDVAGFSLYEHPHLIREATKGGKYQPLIYSEGVQPPEKRYFSVMP